jgi:16S rRNA (guanine966-N2)-methyltransferase
MRIVSGIYKGRKLTPPKDDAIRPTSERTRESLFNLLMHGQFAGHCIREQRVADICSGTGALGLEALSRGASHCTFVDQNRVAIALTQKNAAHLGADRNCEFMVSDATRLPRAKAPFQLIMLDPPYNDNLIAPIYKSLCAQGWVEPGTIISTEMIFTTDLPELPGAELKTERRYGKTKLVIWEVV